VGVSDEQLVASVVAIGDTAAFERLVERHQSRVRNWLRQLTGNHAQADDLAQDTFIRAWTHIDSFRSTGKFVSWLMKIAYNTFLLDCRKNARNQRLTEALGSEMNAATRVVAAPGDLSMDLTQALRLLSDEERAVLVLCYAHGYSHAEISDIADLPLGTVKSHIRRGSAKLRERYHMEEFA
jgi:RNA polymerase sigma-70 factor (ECF subfamily)